LAYWLERAPLIDSSIEIKSQLVSPSPKVAQIQWDPSTNAITPDSMLPGWVTNVKLVAKPDQLIKRRGKAGLLTLNKEWDDVKKWIQDRAGKPQKVGSFFSLSSLFHSG
jgi:ATP citrate (pro-S)-lyase